MSAAPDGSGPGQGGQQNIAAAISEVSERATLLVREEIELAKVEITAKATKLIQGAIVGLVAGVFVLMALIFTLVGFAWLIYYLLPGELTYFWGFFVMAAILLLLGGIAGWLAARAVKRGTPPVPKMAIEEAKKIRETVSSSGAEPPGRSPG